MTVAYTLNNIVYKYGSQTALSLKYLEIRAEKTTALIGPNGSGKSTLLNLLAFLNTPTRGDIRFFDTSADKNNLACLRKRVGFLSQKPYLLRGSVSDNIEIALKLRGCVKAERSKKAATALEKLKISHCASQPANQLSGGERQKTALARILALEPDVLILDEPFNYLDQSSILKLEGFIDSYSGTLVFSTHNRLQGMALADDVMSLVNGELIQTPLVNLFHGRIKEDTFITDNMKIVLPGQIKEGRHASIDPAEIVLSKQALHSSMRNHYHGHITTIAEEKGRVRIEVDAEERFQALITYQAMHELELKLGDSVWVNFKSNAVSVF